MRNNWKKLLSREGVDVTTISVIDRVFFELISKFVNSKKELFFTKFKNKNFTHFIGVDQLALGRKLYKKYFFNINKISSYCQKGDSYLKGLKKNNQKLFNNLDKKSLLKVLTTFEKEFLFVSHIYSITSYLALEAWQYDFDRIIQNLTKLQGLEKDSEAITSSAYLPLKKTALPNLMGALSSGVDPNNLVKKYQFLRSWSAVWYTDIDENWVKNLKSSSIVVEKLENYSNKKLIDKLKPDEQSLKFLKLAPHVVYFKDFRDDVRRAQVFYYSSLFDCIAKYFKVPVLDVGYLTIDEIKKCVSVGKIDYSKVEFRKNNPFIITINSKEEICVKHTNLKKYISIEKDVENSNLKTVVKGVVASKGRVVGKARIIHSHHDIKRVKDGDIMIANTTHPDYFPAMKRAGGIITNEGGLISHAAIVARELNKPCVVGTKNATFVFLEGQMIDLNANTGEIKIL